MTKSDRLLIPVNPTYDWDLDPTEQVGYVNPVRLNDHVIFLANAALRLGLRIDQLSKSLAQAKQDHEKSQHAVDDFQQDLLIKFPPPSLATKSHKLLERFVRQLVAEHDLGDQYQSLLAHSRLAKAAVERLTLELDGARAIAQSIKLAGEHIQTHLSFVKAEARGHL